MIVPSRGGGKTTRMVADAIVKALAGDRVLIACGSRQRAAEVAIVLGKAVGGSLVLFWGIEPRRPATLWLNAILCPN